ncbi:MAG: hypothetical protein IM552_06200, partial [Chitinophagaceae bacterium]|nr:hypothetical protein [Chitinophagaceae bacterium]
IVAEMVQDAMEEDANSALSVLPPSPSTLGGCGLANLNDVNMTADEAREIFDHKRQELAARFGWPTNVQDRSAEDFAIAKSLFYDRLPVQAVAVMLSYGSDKARDRGVSYVEAILQRI